MFQEPAMCQKMIHEQRRYRNGQAGVNQHVARIVEQAIAQAKAQGQTGFPTQKIGALRGASLAMTTQFDKEQQEAWTDDADCSTNQ